MLYICKGNFLLPSVLNKTKKINHKQTYRHHLLHGTEQFHAVSPAFSPPIWNSLTSWHSENCMLWKITVSLLDISDKPWYYPGNNPLLIYREVRACAFNSSYLTVISSINTSQKWENKTEGFRILSCPVTVKLHIAACFWKQEMVGFLLHTFLA